MNSLLPHPERHNKLPSTTNERDFSLMDILCFLKKTWKTISFTSALGLILSLFYLAFAPSKFEAVAQVAMAQIASSNNFSPIGVNIEEPALLMARLSSPTSFPLQTISACSLIGDEDSATKLARSIKAITLKAVPNVIEVKVVRSSPEEAKLCAYAIFELIKSTQALIVAPYIEDAKVRLLDANERLSRANDLLTKSYASGSARGGAYLLARDEIRPLLDEIALLNNVVTSNQSRATRLITPIYVSDEPISPKRRIALAMGLFGGIFLGVFYVLLRQMWLKLKGFESCL